jgi:Skp family chaperone for outer membrane proteins
MKYLIRFFTPAFSSEKHRHAVLNEIGETAEELFREDKYQLIQTLKEVISRKSILITDLTKYILEMLNND